MNRDERKRRFNEAIVNMLYPFPPQHQPELESVEALIEGSDSHVSSATLDDNDNDNDNTSTSGNEEHASDTEMLTRAQRKKIRKKKLKEEAIRRGKLIGPLLPITPTQCGAEDAPPVRSNASEDKGDDSACANLKKIKQRRMVKKLAKEKQNVSASGNSNQSSISCSAVDFKEAPI